MKSEPPAVAGGNRLNPDCNSSSHGVSSPRVSKGPPLRIDVPSVALRDGRAMTWTVGAFCLLHHALPDGRASDTIALDWNSNYGA